MPAPALVGATAQSWRELRQVASHLLFVKVSLGSTTKFHAPRKQPHMESRNMHHSGQGTVATKRFVDVSCKQCRAARVGEQPICGFSTQV